MKRHAQFFDPGLSDRQAEDLGLYEVTPTLEQWKAMQAGEQVSAPEVRES